MKAARLMVLFFFCPASLFAQVAGSPDPTFNPFDQGFGQGDGFNRPLSSITVQPDGKILAGGSMSAFNGIPCKPLARLSADGNLDLGFNPQIQSDIEVVSILIQPDGKIIIGMKSVDFQPSPGEIYLSRLNTDGSLDTTFMPGIGFDSSVYGLALQDDGKILAHGVFSTYNNIPVNKLVRIMPDGSLDPSFNAVISGSFLTSLVIDNNGRILIGGNINGVNGQPADRIARLLNDGSPDTTFQYSGPAVSIRALAIQQDGKIVAGSHGLQNNQTPNFAIFRLNSDGNLDLSFEPNDGFHSVVYCLLISNDGKIIAGGNYLMFNGIHRKAVAKLNLDGSLDTNFNPNNEMFSPIRALTQKADGNIIVAGSFGRRIDLLGPQGQTVPQFNPGHGFNSNSFLPANVKDIQYLSGGKLLVAGEFTRFNGRVNNRIVMLDSIGNQDTTFITGDGFDNWVNCIKILNDGKILVGGGFNYYQGHLSPRLCRLHSNGLPDTTFNADFSYFSYINSISVQPDGSIIAGGTDVNIYPTQVRLNIVRFNPDGSIDYNFLNGNGFNSSINATALQDDGKLVLAGDFTMYNTIGRNRIIRLLPNGAIDSQFNVGSGFNNNVYSLKLLNDGKMLVAGSFTTYNGVQAKGLVRLMPDGAKDATFNTGTGFSGPVSFITISGNGQIICSGDFTTYNGLPCNNLAILNPDGTLDNSCDFGTGPDYYIYATAVQDDGKLLVGGTFTAFNGLGKNRLARLFNNPGLSVEKTATKDFSLLAYPNPSTGFVNLRFATEGQYSIHVLNAYGKEIIKDTLRGKLHWLNLSGLRPGIYFITIYEGENYLGREKIIIQ